MIGEILANADDHSSIDQWFVYGSFSLNQDIHTSQLSSSGELNLIFLNFGNSIYQGFENCKHENHEMYQTMEMLYQKVINTNQLAQTFSKEGMFSLYALQEGFSRLLHEDCSRGIGTMTFIRSFLDLGYNSKDNNSILYILSGKTLIKCNSKFKPFKHKDRYYLSLNDSQTLQEPPSEDCLVKLDEHFPGTLLLTKLFLHEDHLKKLANGKNN